MATTAFSRRRFIGSASESELHPRFRAMSASRRPTSWKISLPGLRRWPGPSRCSPEHKHSFEAQRNVLPLPFMGNIYAAAERFPGETDRLATLDNRFHDLRGQERERNEPAHVSFVDPFARCYLPREDRRARDQLLEPLAPAGNRSEQSRIKFAGRNRTADQQPHRYSAPLHPEWHKAGEGQAWCGSERRLGREQCSEIDGYLHAVFAEINPSYEFGEAWRRFRPGLRQCAVSRGREEHMDIGGRRARFLHRGRDGSLVVENSPHRSNDGFFQ